MASSLGTIEKMAKGPSIHTDDKLDMAFGSKLEAFLSTKSTLLIYAQIYENEIRIFIL